MDRTLLFSSCVSFLAAFVLTWLGWAIARRPATSDGSRTANALFALWWYAFALSSAVSGVSSIVAVFVTGPLRLLVGLQFLNLVSICMGLAGLLGYLVYLYTGRSVWYWPLMLGYAVYGGVLVRMVMGWEPTGAELTPWDVNLVYARPASGASTLVLLIILIGPQLLASVALFVLAGRLPRSASRVRLIVVASGIFVWFGSTFLAYALGVSSQPAWQFIRLFIPLWVGLAVLVVHRPPTWLKRVMPPELPADSARIAVPAAAARRP